MAAIALFLVLGLCAQEKAQPNEDAKIAPYFPTPQTIVDKMLQLGELKAGEKMYDLGSGDGRIVIMAARKYKADATGVELDDALYKQSASASRPWAWDRSRASSMATCCSRITLPTTC